MKNPVFFKGDEYLRFTEAGSFVVVRFREAHTVQAHRKYVEEFLDGNGISWASTGSESPGIAVSTGDDPMTILTWPFELTAPLPMDLVDKCDAEICTYADLDSSEDYVLYGDSKHG